MTVYIIRGIVLPSKAAIPIWSDSDSLETVNPFAMPGGSHRPAAPDDLSAVNRVAGAPHRLKEAVAQFHFADQRLGAIFARLLRHRVKHVQPNRIVIILVERRRQIHNMRIGFVLTMAELPDHVLVFDLRDQRMQAARKDDARKQSAALAARVFRQARIRCAARSRSA